MKNFEITMQVVSEALPAPCALGFDVTKRNKRRELLISINIRAFHPENELVIEGEFHNH